MMMKKLRILVMLIILAFSFSVKADVLFEIDCKGNEISDNNDLSCELGLYYEQEGINDIEFDFKTNLDISFSTMQGFSMTKQDNRISIHSDITLSDEIMNYTPIIGFSLSSNDKVGDIESLLISNIVINKNDSIKVFDISKSFNIIREVIKLDDVCTLNSITVEKEKVKDFNKDKLEYYGINVTKEIIFIDAERTSDKSMATGLGDKKVEPGETKEIDITVTAEDGTQKIYKLFITNINPKEIKEEIKPEVSLSTDTSLKTLELFYNDREVNLEFYNNKNIYNIDLLDEEVDNLTIKAKLNDSKASFIKNYGPRDIKIKHGLNKELIKIKAENGEERIITFNINFIEKEIFFEDEITLGDNKLNISSSKENVIVENNNETSKDINHSHPIINIICYIVFGVGLICLIVSTLYIIKYKK